MLPARKQEPPLNNTTPSAAGGFSKVLNSIQGLQQRLDDFSVEDVSRAQAKAENLIRELSVLQLKLNCLAITEQALTDARRTISAIADNNFDPVGLDSLEKYPTLHVLLKASPLVEFVIARAQSFADYIDELNAARETAAAITVNSERQALQALSSPISQPEASSAMEPGCPEKASAEPLLPTAQLDKLPSQEPRDQHSQTASLPGKLQDGTGQKKISISATSHFNQRLLDDLIDTYGDFASSANLSASGEAPKPVTPKASAYKPATAHSAKLAEVGLPATLEAPRVKVTTAELVPVKMAPAEIIPALEVEHPRPTGENATTAAKQGEIDRQLKDIIKDYGEYDLYQRHNPVNLKLVGTLALVFLLLVLGGLYFFRSPVASVPADPAGKSNAQSTSGLPEREGAGTNSAAAARASSGNVTTKGGPAETRSDTVINMKQKK